MQFLVTIIGDHHRAAALLAKVGIQTLFNPMDVDRVIARLSADDPDAAVDRVRLALEGDAFGGGSFKIGEAHPEE
jgi:hypothetical protein